MNYLALSELQNQLDSLKAQIRHERRLEQIEERNNGIKLLELEAFSRILIIEANLPKTKVEELRDTAKTIVMKAVLEVDISK